MNSRASLAYRKNEAAILRGDVPEKYARLLPFIGGDSIIELGSAEGVLAFTLACAGKNVVAVEANLDRHRAAMKLGEAWTGKMAGSKGMVFLKHARAEEMVPLLSADPASQDYFDTLVAVRMIYYLGAQLDPVFAEVARHIPCVVLCGNGNRAARFHEGRIPADDKLGPMNFYASAEGMSALLERHGYTVTVEVSDGDPIVVGRKDVTA